MKALAFLKVSLKGLIKEFPTFVLSYALYPIVIALIMGYVQQGMFTPSINDPIFSIAIVDEDRTRESENLVSFLKSEEMSQILTVVSEDNEDFDYNLRIPYGYQDSLLGKTPASVRVEAEEKSSTSMGNLLVNIVDKYNLDVSQNLVIQQGIDKLSLEENRDQLVEEIYSTLYTSYGTNSFELNIHNVKKSLDSFEYYSVSLLNFTFIMFIMAVIASDALEKENGLYSRILSTSMTRIQYFNYGLLSSYLMMVVVNLLYAFAFRIPGLSFNGSLPLLLLIIIVQSLMITLLGSLISLIFKKKYGIPIVQIFLIFQVVFGGMMGPLEKWNGSRIFKFFGKYKPDILITNTYRNYIIYNDFDSISKYLLIMVAVSLIVYLLGLMVVKLKWGESR